MDNGTSFINIDGNIISTDEFSNSKGLIIKGDLNIANNEYICLLPDDLSILGNLSIINCKHLSSIGVNLVVQGNMEIQYCPIKSILSCVKVKDHLSFLSCGIVNLPINMKVFNLSIFNCLDLIELPPYLHVENNIFITHCPSLETIQDETFVGGIIKTINVSKLDNIPEHLYNKIESKSLLKKLKKIKLIKSLF